MRTGEALVTAPRVPELRSALLFSPDGRLLAATDGGDVALADAATGEVLHRLRTVVPTYQQPRIAFDARGARLAACTVSGELRIFDLARGARESLRLRVPVGAAATIVGLALAPDGEDAAIALYDGRLLLVSLADADTPATTLRDEARRESGLRLDGFRVVASRPGRLRILRR